MESIEVTSRLVEGPLGLPVMNLSGINDGVITEDASVKEIAHKLGGWIERARATGDVIDAPNARSRRSNLFDRGVFTPPNNPYNEMIAARAALDDDIVGGVAEITEGFAFQGLKWEGEDTDGVDIFNQIARDIDLDSVVRRMWHEQYALSQYVAAARWGFKTYQVRGKTESGNRRKKRMTVYCPREIVMLDSLKVVPVGEGPFGMRRLAWHGGQDLITRYRQVLQDEVIDPGMSEFFVGKYTPASRDEDKQLTDLGIDTDSLLLMDPRTTWRATMTRPDYARFARVRMKSLFPILDLKRQLIASDRAMLIGAANYILLVRKGTKEQPGSTQEISHLKSNFNFVAKLPVIISDHRLDIDIIAPKTDFTLDRDKYNVLDRRMQARLLGTLSLGGDGQRNETNITISQAVARGMENRRKMLARSLERHIARAVVEHPFNEGLFSDLPSLVYVPRNIGLEVNQAAVQAVLALRTQRELSRETILEYFGLDQATEAQRMEMEEEFYDEIFKTRIPFDSPEGRPPAETGPQGGRPAGGGGSNNPTAARPRTEQGNPSTRQES